MGKYIPPEMVKEIKKIDLLTYFKNYEPNELVRDSRTQYSTKTHSSLKISNGYWNYFNGGFGGKNAVDYVEKMLGYKFPESIEYIIKKMNGRIPVYIPQAEKRNNVTLILPEKNDNTNRVKQYLNSRGIDNEIIQKCIEKHRMSLRTGKNENNRTNIGSRFKAPRQYLQSINNIRAKTGRKIYVSKESFPRIRIHQS